MVSLSSLIAVSKPSGLWPIIINGIDKGIANFGWTIVIFTILVKFVLMPLDFWMKLSSKKSSLVQKKLAPQIEKINKKYANNRQMASMQTTALYKKEGYNIFGSCFFMLAYLVLTMVVFFTLFASLRDFSAYRMLDQYEACRTEYNSVLNETGDIKQAKTAASKEWDKSKDSWLWVSNIWQSDNQSNEVPTYSSLKSTVSKSKDSKAQKRMKKISKEEYDQIMSKSISENKGDWNGYYILAVIAAITTFLSQWISELGNGIKRKKPEKSKEKTKEELIAIANGEKPKNQNMSNSTTMKVMKFILPVFMVIFVLTSSSAFGIYIISSSIFSMISSFLINMLVKKMTKNKEQEVVEFLEKKEKKAKA